MSGQLLDLIEELKLRRWARLNHRRLVTWDESLHPIVLEELQHIRDEQQSEPDAGPQTAFGYVPLAPHQGFSHTYSDLPTDTAIASSDTPDSTETDAPACLPAAESSDAAAAFVPLLPDGHHRLDPPATKVPAPGLDRTSRRSERVWESTEDVNWR